MAATEKVTCGGYSLTTLENNDDVGRRVLIKLSDDKGRRYVVDALNLAKKGLVADLLSAMGKAWPKCDFQFTGRPGDPGDVVSVP
jgi:hypothetical protein